MSDSRIWFMLNALGLMTLTAFVFFVAGWWLRGKSGTQASPEAENVEDAQDEYDLELELHQQRAANSALTARIHQLEALAVQPKPEDKLNFERERHDAIVTDLRNELVAAQSTLQDMGVLKSDRDKLAQQLEVTQKELAETSARLTELETRANPLTLATPVPEKLVKNVRKKKSTQSGDADDLPKFELPL